MTRNEKIGVGAGLAAVLGACWWLHKKTMSDVAEATAAKPIGIPNPATPGWPSVPQIKPSYDPGATSVATPATPAGAPIPYPGSIPGLPTLPALPSGYGVTPGYPGTTTSPGTVSPGVVSPGTVSPGVLDSAPAPILSPPTPLYASYTPASSFQALRAAPSLQAPAPEANTTFRPNALIRGLDSRWTGPGASQLSNNPLARLFT